MTGGAGHIMLYLVRHGETEWSRSGRHTGHTDLALTADGEDQARALGPLLRSVRFSHVLSSPALRARATCALAGLAATMRIEPDLAEWNYGAYEGLLTSEIRVQWPDWSPYRDGCPEGESAPDIADRADRLIVRLRRLPGNVALFSHGQFGCALAARWMGAPVSLGQHLLFDTASFGVLGFHPAHPEVPVVAHWNLSARIASTGERT